jgi:hypothetical protein
MDADQADRENALRRALVEGEESGAPRPFDPVAFLKRVQERYASRQTQAVIPAEQVCGTQSAPRKREGRDP